ncbi:exonuclease domain-containing protein [Peredibacter sp. HCB2-198]|uniref:exonuclease domain-containing protein n=1 Tax=Peredibacter sp. HCB2-198 TaxID=3383025 RepID=UPI0038B4FE0E
MKYLSIDIEATGLAENCQIIEFAMIPFDTQFMRLEDSLARTMYIHCPSFEDLKPTLDPWVREHNEKIIRKAHAEGMMLSEFKEFLKNYLESKEVREYFNNQKIVLFGKSMTAIDLPFLTRDLGWDFMRKYFHHRNLDLSGVGYSLIDLGMLPQGMDSGSNLMNHLGMGEVAHTALEDAKNTAIMYLKLLEKYSAKKN